MDSVRHVRNVHVSYCDMRKMCYYIRLSGGIKRDRLRRKNGAKSAVFVELSLLFLLISTCPGSYSIWGSQKSAGDCGFSRKKSNRRISEKSVCPMWFVLVRSLSDSRPMFPYSQDAALCMVLVAFHMCVYVTAAMCI